jgi:DNA invertase Pin-like site-specific DNA recombinase
VVYFDNGPWIRACYVRVSSEKQRSGQLLAGEDVLDADEAPGSSEEGWSEAVQIERLLDYCVATPAENGTLPSIAFYNDSSLSGRLTTDDTALIQDVNNKHSTLYKEVFTKVFLSPSYTKNLQPDEITAREQYRDAVVAKIAEGFKDAATTADIEILRKRRRYKSDFNFRPAICELVADIEKREIGEVLFTDLSRFFRGP